MRVRDEWMRVRVMQTLKRAEHPNSRDGYSMINSQTFIILVFYAEYGVVSANPQRAMDTL